MALQALEEGVTHSSSPKRRLYRRVNAGRDGAPGAASKHIKYLLRLYHIHIKYLLT